MTEPRIEFGLCTPDQVAGKTGLEVLQGIVAGDLPAPPISRLLDFRLAAVEAGRAEFHGTASRDLYNPQGTVHGGYLATLMDSAMTCAVQSLAGPGEGFTTAEFKINFLRPVTETTGRLTAVGTIVSKGRRMGVAEARLTDDDGKLYAYASTTCVLVERG